MQSEERQKRIEEYLYRVEFASLDELSKQVGASISTVRRDLTALELAGNIRRTHGGARVLNPRSDEFIFSKRDTVQWEEKEAIGSLCAGLVRTRESVIIDAGTTVYHVARHLDDQPLQIVTNSLPVANLFTSSQKIEVVVSGGVIYPRLGVLVGPFAIETFSKVHADVAIMSGGGITLEGVTNSHALLIDIQRAMIQAADRVVFCIDHTKFGRRSVAHLCGLESIDTIVTDAGAPADVIEGLRARGLEVLVADVPAGESPRPQAAASSSTAASPPPAPAPPPRRPAARKRKPARPARLVSSKVESDLSDGGMSWD
jgi:DeoR family fructose operon transcriptional repressor